MTRIISCTSSGVRELDSKVGWGRPNGEEEEAVSVAREGPLDVAWNALLLLT